MTESVPPPDHSRSQEPDLSHYKPQYNIDVKVWRQYLDRFKGAPLTDNEIHAMADGMIKFMTDSMNHLMNQALKEMKDREQREKEAQNS
jgi:hypothetical protein